MNLLRKHLSHSSVVGQSCRVCLLARRGSRWMAKTKVDNGIFPIIIPGWRRVLRGEVLLRLGDWDVGSAGCATTPMVRMSTGDHGPSWACATRPSRSVAAPKLPKCSSPKRASSVLHTIAGCDHNSVVQAAIIAPPLEHFIALLRRLKESHSKLGRKGNTMAWCLFEALRDDECKFLATEDSRASGLLTKWVACGGSDRCGLALQLATRKGLRTFATCRRGGKTAASGPT
jgi:hypothetical protein